METQSCNVPAIHCYMKNGFKIIGFDTHSYSNCDIEKHEVRIEMGMEIIGTTSVDAIEVKYADTISKLL